MTVDAPGKSASGGGAGTRGGTKSSHEVLASPDFALLVSRRWSFSILLTACLFVLYYGFILLVALDKPFLATKVGEATTLGIPLGVAVIVLSWVLTAAYVRWANRAHDSEVERLRKEMGR
jgi:uncharacterized membrane protein (DUF485 family)